MDCVGVLVLEERMAKARGDLGFRVCRAEDVEEIAPILYNAFTHFNLSVGIPPQTSFFSTLQAASHSLHATLAPNSTSLGVIAFLTSSCKPVGAGFLHFTGQGIQSIGPVFVDPSYGDNGAGKAITQFLLDHAEKNKASSVRLLQDCSNMKSFSLYAKLGFQPVECLSTFEGSIEPNIMMDVCSTLGIKPMNDIFAREMREDDVNLCADLFKRTMGYDRSLEIRAQLLSCPENAWVAERNGDLVAYTLALNLSGHTVATSEEAFLALFIHVSQQWMGKAAPKILLPGRLFPRLVRWALASKLRLIGHVWYMVRGEYQNPQNGHVYCPSRLH